MANTIKMVVFDMAGTTVDENNVVYKTLQKALEGAGYPFTLDQVLLQGAGKEKLQAIKDILHTYAGIDDDVIAKTVYASFIGQLASAYKTLDILPQPNAVELFSALKERGILTVLNTGYNRETAESILKKLSWQKGVEFDALVTASEVKRNRPEPDMIWYAMKTFDVPMGKSVVKVGDSAIDIEEGKNAGCLLSIGITTGAHTAEQLSEARPDHILNNLIELLPIIDGMV